MHVVKNNFIPQGPEDYSVVHGESTSVGRSEAVMTSTFAELMIFSLTLLSPMQTHYYGNLGPCAGTGSQPQSGKWWKLILYCCDADLNYFTCSSTTKTGSKMYS